MRSLDFTVRPLTPTDRDWVASFCTEHWGADLVAAHGTTYQPSTLPGFCALVGDRIAGLVTYHVAGSECEIVTIDSVLEGRGIGTALIAAVEQVAREQGCRRLWLITTNDNIPALRFYQTRGFVLAALYRDAVSESRVLKPQIPLLGHDGIPIRDEIEFERDLRMEER